MSNLVITVEDHGNLTTVSEMRRRLAQILSKLNGDQHVSFVFRATLENYQPSSEGHFPRATTKPRVLEAPYGLANAAPNVDPYIAFGELAGPEND